MSTNRPQTAAELAAGLRMIADRFDTLGDAPLPDVFVGLDLLPHGGEDVEIAAIDLIGNALYGTPGETRQLSSGTYHHKAGGEIAGIRVVASTEVTSPEQRELRAELDRLRALVGEKAGVAR